MTVNAANSPRIKRDNRVSHLSLIMCLASVASAAILYCINMTDFIVANGHRVVWHRLLSGTILLWLALSALYMVPPSALPLSLDALLVSLIWAVPFFIGAATARLGWLASRLKWVLGAIVLATISMCGLLVSDTSLPMRQEADPQGWRLLGVLGAFLCLIVALVGFFMGGCLTVLIVRMRVPRQ